MKIALVSDWFFPLVGGVEVQMRDLALELQRRGYDVDVITSVAGPRDIDGIRVRRLPLPRIPYYRVAFSPGAVTALGDVIRAQGYDVVHGHGSYSPLAWAATFVARRLGIPSVLTSHNVLGPAVTSLLRGLNRGAGFAAWPEVVTAVSTLTRDEMARVCSRAVALVPNGTQLTFWRRQRCDAPSAPQAVSALRFYVRKGPQRLVHAIPRLLEGNDARLVLVGDGPHRASLERWVARAGFGDRVTFTGIVSRERLRDIYAASQLYIHANVKEAFGLTALEARATGLPVVAMRQSGVRDLVDHGRTGLLADDLDDWIACVRTMLSNQTTRRVMSAASLHGLERFAIERVTEQYLAVYAQAHATPLAEAA